MITERIKALMLQRGLSASAFADKLGVQRSGMSHIFSGRNRPSLDLVIKITEAFPEVTLDWLILGIGDTGAVNGTGTSTAQTGAPESTPNAVTNVISTDVTSLSAPLASDERKIGQTVEKGEMDGVIILYRDGTFRNYTGR